jgi:hypothetical protein
MKVLRLTGRERAVLKGIDETSGSTGQEIIEHSHIEESDLTDVLNGLINSGYVEAYAPNEQLPLVQEIHHESIMTTRFEMNPAYIHEIRIAMRRG